MSEFPLAFEQIFADDLDHIVAKDMIEELYWNRIRRHTFYAVSQTDTPLNIYGEPDEIPVDPVEIGATQYATEVQLLAADPADGTRAYAQDTTNFFVRSANEWISDIGEPIYHKFTAPDPYPDDIPIHIKLEPEVELLDRYGYDRVRDALVYFCIPILDKVKLTPKVGDRLDFNFTSTGVSTIEHLEIHEISSVDFQRQTGVPYTLVAAADRTHKKRITG